jgi:hypothetical protein
VLAEFFAVRIRCYQGQEQGVLKSVNPHDSESRMSVNGFPRIEEMGMDVIRGKTGA